MSRLLRLIVWCVVLASPAWAAPWPEVPSDLPADPALRAGKLENGLRYFVLPNQTPKGRASLRLVVAAGSLLERDDERGLTHFVEHMAFRGTKEHPAGSLGADLERLGLAMGPDNTAFTFTDHTIYHLELPDTSDETLRTGLRTFREYAESITFDPALIERERGVVLSEMSTRDTPDYRLGRALEKFLWKSSRALERSPIGLANQLRTFTREQFVAYYDAWYRPERLAVIVVGDADPERVTALIHERFDSLKARGEPRPEPADLATAEPSVQDVGGWSDAGFGGLTLLFQHPYADPLQASTTATRAANLQRDLAFAMFQQRLSLIAMKLGSSFVAPSTSHYEGPPGWSVAQVSVNGRADNWRIIARDVEQEHRRVFLHGFTTQELRTAKVSLTANIEEAVRSASTRQSEGLAAHLVWALLRGHVFSTPETYWRDIQPLLERTTAADCTAAFRSTWSTKAPHVFYASFTGLGVTRDDVAKLLNESRLVEVKPPEEKPEPVFAYTDFGPPGKLVREDRVDDLDVRLTEFANGVRLNFKQTDFESDHVDVHVRVGTGKATQPENQPGLDMLASTALISTGLKRHSNEDISRIFAGHPMQLGFGVDWDCGCFSARCSKRDLPLCLQMITAFLTEAAYSADMMSSVRASFGTTYQHYANSPGGPTLMIAERVLAGGDHRWGVPLGDELFARNLDELAAWLEPQFKHGGIEMSVVGDVPWEEARDLVARTLGALPQREARAAAKPGPVFHAAPPPKSMIISASNPQMKQVSLALLFPIPDQGEVRAERRLHLLAAIVEDRLRHKIREELGATYSPDASLVDHEAQPGLDYLWCYADVDPARYPQVAVIMKRELQALHDRGPTDDEFTRAKNPFVSDRLADLRSNAYWSYTVLRDAQERPERLTAARNRTEDTKAITREEIAELATRYLQIPKSFFFVSVPGVQPMARPK